MNPADLTATDARARIATGELSPVALVDACLANIDRVNPNVNAVVARDDEQARAMAHEAEATVRRGDPVGPLHGLPVLIKDIQAVAGMPLTFGAVELADNVPVEDAGIVARIRAAGGIIIGKTNVPEYSIGANTVNPLFGATGNPFDTNRTSGGSSGGSAAAVATRMAPLATGSDHGGSLRIPASYCGVVGYRATPGMVPNELRGTTQTYYSVQGPMARTVADCALLLSVICRRGDAVADPMAFPLDADALANPDDCDPASLRVGVTPDLGGVLVSETVRRSFAERVARIETLVGSCEPCAVDLTDAPDVDWHLRQELFLAQWEHAADDWEDDFNPNIRQTYDAALETSLLDYARARRRQTQLQRDFARAFEHFDLIVCPGVSVPPFPWRELNPQTIDGHAVENYMAWLGLSSSLTVIGHPVVALPCGTDQSGLPLGIQVVAPMYADRRLLAMAQALEKAFQQDPVLTAPVADLGRLAAAESDCRIGGRTVGQRA